MPDPRSLLSLPAIVLAGLFMVGGAAGQPNPDRLPAAPNSPDVFITVERPAAAGRVPVAILLHGGGGLVLAQLDGFKEWAAWLAQRGIASVMVDSFRGRPKDVQASPDKAAAYTALLRMRALDIERTVAWLVTTGWADPARLFLFGESQGGSAALIASAERGNRLPQVLFYPLCAAVPVAARGADYPRTLFVMAGNDRLAPAGACVETQARLSAQGAPAASLRLATLPDAYHSFDLPLPKPMEWLGHRIEYNPKARDASRVEVDTFLRTAGLAR